MPRLFQTRKHGERPDYSVKTFDAPVQLFCEEPDVNGRIFDYVFQSDCELADANIAVASAVEHTRIMFSLGDADGSFVASVTLGAGESKVSAPVPIKVKRNQELEVRVTDGKASLIRLSFTMKVPKSG